MIYRVYGFCKIDGAAKDNGYVYAKGAKCKIATKLPSSAVALELIDFGIFSEGNLNLIAHENQIVAQPVDNPVAATPGQGGIGSVNEKILEKK